MKRSGDGLDKINSHFLNIKKSMYIIQIFDKSRNSAVNVSTRNTLRRDIWRKWLWEVGLGNKRNWSQLLFNIISTTFSFALMHIYCLNHSIFKIWISWKLSLVWFKDPKQLSWSHQKQAQRKPPHGYRNSACNRTFRKWQSSLHSFASLLDRYFWLPVHCRHFSVKALEQ